MSFGSSETEVSYGVTYDFLGTPGAYDVGFAII